MTYQVSRPEDLPRHQPPIETSSVIKLRKNLRLLLDVKDKTGYSMMGIITGRSGLGKTVAIYAFVKSLPQQSHTAQPEAIIFRVPEEPTPRLVVASLLQAYGEKSDGTKYEMLTQVKEIVPAAMTRLIIADEADYLDTKTFDTLRYIHDETGVSIAVVGLPRLIGVVRQHKKFSSRIGLIEKFEPLSETEVLETVLPNLVFPQWQFDPANDDHDQLGQFVWKTVKPSLRNLRNLLSRASMRALAYGDNRLIDRQIVEQALQMGGDFSDKEMDEDDDDDDDDDDDWADDPSLGEMERESLRRRKAKCKRTKK